MSTKIHKVNGIAFDIVEFKLCPREVEDLFILDGDFQRDIRKTPMIQGIQRTLIDTRTLRSLIHVHQPEGEDRYVVIDGKHRLSALADLDHHIRCTVFGVLHKTHGVDEVVRLFEELNKTLPPTLGHFYRLQSDRKTPAVVMLQTQLSFPIRIQGSRPTRHKGTVPPSLNRVVNILARAFADIDHVNRFQMDGILASITQDHVVLLSRFGEIFQAAAGPIGSTNPRFRNGWFDVVFRIFVQNLNLHLTNEDWTERLDSLFNDGACASYFDKPKVHIGYNSHRLRILKALSIDSRPKITFKPKALPTIHEINALSRKSSKRKVG